MVSVNRVTKVVKGAASSGFAALTVVGDGDAVIGMGKGKAREVPVSICKKPWMKRAARWSRSVSKTDAAARGRGEHARQRSFMQPASEGTGIIAGTGCGRFSRSWA